VRFVEEKKQTLKMALQKSEELFSSLQQQAFRGELSNKSTRFILPRTTRVSLPNSTLYLSALIYAYLIGREDQANLKELVNALTVIGMKENHSEDYAEILGGEFKKWSKSHNDTFELNSVLSVMKRSCEAGWISITESGSLSIQDLYKLPNGSEWAQFDMEVTLELLERTSNITEIEDSKIIDLSSLIKTA